MEALKEHQRLTRLISEEAIRLEHAKTHSQVTRLEAILEFLTELQVIKAKELI